MECFRPHLRRGIPSVINSGRHKANLTIFGNNDVKKVEVSDSVRVCKIYNSNL